MELQKKHHMVNIQSVTPCYAESKAFKADSYTSSSAKLKEA